MRKLVILAALIAASMNSVKAQSINVINQCGEKSHIINFAETDAYGIPVQYHRIESHCPKQEFPTFRLGIGNYSFDDLNIPETEQWFCEIKQAGKVVKKGFLTLNRFDVVLKDDMTILILISPKPKCNCN